MPAQAPPQLEYNGFGLNYRNRQSPGMGMGHMLERMHNVSERDFLPQKRRKLEQPEEDAERKANFSGAGKGGVLGEYMREKKEQDLQEAAVNGIRPAVDLTGGIGDHLNLGFRNEGC